MLLSPEAEDDEDSIHIEIDYLVKDPKHEHEKPYEIRYDTGGLIPERNMVDVTTPVVVYNFDHFKAQRASIRTGLRRRRLTVF
jgi:hypothetical protein